MRFPVLLFAGLACIAVGISLSEWSRRHPAEKPAVEAVAPSPAPVVVSSEALVATEPPVDLPSDTEALRNADAELSSQAKSVALPEDITTPQAAAVLGGSLFARNVIAQGNAVFLVSEEGKQGTRQSVLRITSTGSPKALAAHRTGVTALAADGARLWWAEDGAIYSTDANTGGAAQGVVRFPNARITSLGARGGKVVATLVPKQLDPFSSEAVGAVVAVFDGKVSVLATKQARPAEAGTDGTTGVWVAGYPADLLGADLTTRALKTLSTRADGPVLLNRGVVTFRHPLVGNPELQQVSVQGGEPRTLARGEIDHVTQSGTDLWFSMGGTLTHLDASGANPREVAKLPRQVLELAATDDALYVVTRQEQGGHLLLRLPRSTPEGSRP